LLRAGVFGAFSVAAVAAGLALGCPGRVPPPNVPAAATPAPIPAATPAPVSEARLLELEDRRRFEAAVLESAAAAPDAPVRARAALALGRIGDERAGPLLEKLLADPSADVRRTAAFAAGILGEPGLSRALIPRLEDPEASVSERAGWALSVLGEPSGGEALIAAVAAAPPDRRAALIQPLWRFSTPAAAAAASRFVEDPDARTRAAALYALARRPQESSLGTLTAALSDPDADTAALCARALGLLGKPESIGPLSKTIEGSRTPVTIAAMLGLAAVLEKNPSAAPHAAAGPRLLALSRDTNPNLAVPALSLLRWLAADREVFRRLWSLASGGRGRRQQVALVAAMAGLGQGSRDLVDAAIASADPFLRGTAAEALEYLPAAEADSRRARLASDPELFVRLKLLEGLRTAEAVGRNRAVVDAALADPNPVVQAGAVSALGLSTDPSALAAIREAVVRSYPSPAPDVAVEALAAAEARAADPEARAVAEAAYRHPAVLVSRLARRSLVKRFHADPAAFPWRTYEGKPEEAYARAAASERDAPAVRVETERGSFTIRLAPAHAPMTAANFVALARRGYFDGVRIHRVAPGFVVQDGDPTGTGSGGPGYEIRDELHESPYERGTVGMALAGPDTGGSQWFVTQAPQPHLDGAYTVFGRVVAGMDVVDRIEQGERIVRVSVPAEQAP
jgi:cyclophilin family peptidyl-prolyl cis-trans isomerase/HEAT repeat protein